MIKKVIEKVVYESIDGRQYQTEVDAIQAIDQFIDWYNKQKEL